MYLQGQDYTSVVEDSYTRYGLNSPVYLGLTKVLDDPNVMHNLAVIGFNALSDPATLTAVSTDIQSECGPFGG
jgi:hypothetical protein